MELPRASGFVSWPLLEHQELRDMSIGVSWVKSKVLCAVFCEFGHFLDGHVVWFALDWPIEENGTDFTSCAKNHPSNSPMGHVVSGLIGPDCMIATFLKVIAGLIPVAGYEVITVSQRQRDKIATCVAAIFPS